MLLMKNVRLELDAVAVIVWYTGYCNKETLKFSMLARTVTTQSTTSSVVVVFVQVYIRVFRSSLQSV
jgi:hypothetical protein